MHRDNHQRHGDSRQPDRTSRSKSDDAAAARDEQGFDEAHYLGIFRDAPYFSSGRSWRDYAPAYRYGHRAHAHRRDRRFEDVETDLAAHWDEVKADSRLLWSEARYAVRDAWLHFDADSQPGHGRGRHD